MIELPIATEISKALPKKAIFAKFGLKPRLEIKAASEEVAVL